MTSTFLRWVFLACAWMILGSAMSIKHAAPAPTALDAMYHFYWSDDDTYLNYNSVIDEENEIGTWTGKLINTQAGGGILIARGYINSVSRHKTLPAVQL